MQIVRISFYAQQPITLPLAHFEALQGLFYRLLSDEPDYSEAVHDRPQQQGRQYKFFCFDDFRGKYRISGKTIIFTGPLTWEIRSVYDFITETVTARLTDRPVFQINGQTCFVTKVDVTKSLFLSSPMRFQLLTPVVAHKTDADGHTVYLAPTDREFTSALLGNLAGKFSAATGEELPDNVRLKLIHPESFTKCVTRYKSVYITGYYGMFEPDAPEAVIETLYYAGLGEKNPQGFGFLGSAN